MPAAAPCPVCPPPQVVPNCAGWKAIRPSREDKLSRGTQEQLLAHNEFGVKQGCWPAP